MREISSFGNACMIAKIFVTAAVTTFTRAWPLWAPV